VSITHYYLTGIKKKELSYLTSMNIGIDSNMKIKKAGSCSTPIKLFVGYNIFFDKKTLLLQMQ
jgi:hypothetical protein